MRQIQPQDAQNVLADAQSLQAIDKDEISTRLAKLAQTPEQFRKINTFMKRRSHMSQYHEHALLDAHFRYLYVNPTDELGKLSDISAIRDLRVLFTDTPNGSDASLVLEITLAWAIACLRWLKCPWKPILLALKFMNLVWAFGGVGR